MIWNATRILWDEQVLLLCILLPPIFLLSGILAFAAPVLFREKRNRVSDPQAIGHVGVNR